ncbi:MAG: DivIVA domain-containing protein [Bifidobacteriaceae bacterium]|jgi:DivIVA domain-containing protein|nr:DivIVA domain-containing protein [Bifidobacteriaceae bacterium]
MAQLTADDVVLKVFQATKFREGYDQVEVDDFLDAVALSMRTLAAENDELRNKLAAAELRIAELESGAPVAPAERPTLPPLALPTFMEAVPSPGAPEEESATGMLALARKLHDQYVTEGQKEGDQILSEAKAKAAGIVREAEEVSARTKARLEQEQADLEREIESLRIFERDYRTRLRTYLGSLLSEIDGAPDKGQRDTLGS